MNTFFRHGICLLAAALFSHSAAAHEYNVGDMHIKHPHANPTLPGQTSGAAYFGIVNGSTPDKLLSISTPAAGSASLHQTIVEGNVVKMREAETLEIAPNATIQMAPGSGYHVMLMNLKNPLKAGDKLPMTLTFEKAGKVEVSVTVDRPDEIPGGGAKPQ